MTIEDIFTELRTRKYHPFLFASEGHKHPWLAMVRGQPEQGGASPQEAATNLLTWVDRNQPPTTAELRKAGRP